MLSDIQTAGVDYFKTYSPVGQWSTIHPTLTMILSNNCHTKQVVYTNAFAQAYFKAEVYIGFPHGFGWSDGISKVIRLSKGPYGIIKPPNRFFDKIWAGRLEW